MLEVHPHYGEEPALLSLLTQVSASSPHPLGDAQSNTVRPNAWALPGLVRRTHSVATVPVSLPLNVPFYEFTLVIRFFVFLPVRLPPVKNRTSTSCLSNE